MICRAARLLREASEAGPAPELHSLAEECWRRRLGTRARKDFRYSRSSTTSLPSWGQELSFVFKVVASAKEARAAVT